jgi:hypothetical protein
VRKSSLWLFICAALVAQDDPQRAELRKKDLQRIAARPRLKEKVQGISELPAWTPKTTWKTFKLVVIPIGFSDDAGEEQPKVFEKLQEYVKQNSGGRLDFKVSIEPRIVLKEARAVVSKDRIGSEEEGKWVTKWFDRAAVKGADGVCLAYAGILEPGKNSMLWPHETSIDYGSAPVRYYIAPQGGASSASIHGHEFMHLFGLKDKYDRETPHCILAYGYQPLRVCGSCRSQLGWADTAVVMPEQGGWVRLKEFSKQPECLRIDLVASGTEYLLVELCGKELLFWHTAGGSTQLVAQLDGKTADRLTPYSEPRFRAKSAGSRPLFVTDIRIEGGEATFKVSGSEPLTDLEQDNLSRVGRVINPK